MKNWLDKYEDGGKKLSEEELNKKIQEYRHSPEWYEKSSGRADVTMSPHEYLMALPENAIGDALFTGAGKLVSPVIKKITPKASQIAASILERINNSARGTMKELSDVPKMIKKGYSKTAKEALESGNQWSREWYQHPEFSRRLDILRKNTIDEKKAKDLYFVKQHSRNMEVMGYSPEEIAQAQKNYMDYDYDKIKTSADYIKENLVNEPYLSNFETKRNKIANILTGEKHVHSNNWGISGYNLDRFSKTKGRQNLVDKYIGKHNVKSTAIHEGAHGITDGENLINEYGDILQEPFDLENYSRRLISGEYKRYQDYILDPTEIYARMQQGRAAMGVKPGEIWTDEMTNDFINRGLSKNNKLIDPVFFKLIKNPEKLKDLFNTFPAVAAPIGIAGAISENNKATDEYEYGGEINANESFVSFPPNFVGMGNNTRGRNYSPAWGGQFDIGGSLPGTVGFTYARHGAPSEGKYAKKTLPSAEDGVNIQDLGQYRKLNQLINFTNYNEPQSGGWLDKYK